MQGTECDLRLRSVFCHCVPELFSCDTSSSHFTSTTILGQIYRTRLTDETEKRGVAGDTNAAETNYGHERQEKQD